MIDELFEEEDSSHAKKLSLSDEISAQFNAFHNQKKAIYESIYENGIEILLNPKLRTLKKLRNADSSTLFLQNESLLDREDIAGQMCPFLFEMIFIFNFLPEILFHFSSQFIVLQISIRNILVFRGSLSTIRRYFVQSYQALRFAD